MKYQKKGLFHLENKITACRMDPSLCTKGGCPVPTMPGAIDRDESVYLWSDVSIWDDMREASPDNFGIDKLPKAGANLTIPSDWQLTVDMDTPELGHVELNGVMLFSTERDVVFSTGTMANPLGEIRAGNATNPHPTKVRDTNRCMLCTMFTHAKKEYFEFNKLFKRCIFYMQYFHWSL